MIFEVPQEEGHASGNYGFALHPPERTLLPTARPDAAGLIFCEEKPLAMNIMISKLLLMAGAG